MFIKPLAILNLSVLALGVFTSPARADLTDVVRGVSVANDIVKSVSTLTKPQPKVSNPIAPQQQLAPPQQQLVQQQLAQQQQLVQQQQLAQQQQLVQQQQLAQQRPKPTAVDMLQRPVDAVFDLANWAGRGLFP